MKAQKLNRKHDDNRKFKRQFNLREKIDFHPPKGKHVMHVIKMDHSKMNKIGIQHIMSARLLIWLVVQKE